MLNGHLSNALGGTGLSATATSHVSDDGFAVEYTPINSTSNAQLLYKLKNCTYISAYQTSLDLTTNLSNIVVTHACVVESGTNCTSADAISCSSDETGDSEPSSGENAGEDGSGETASEDKLSTAAIAGIVVGCVLGVGAIVAGLLAWMFLRKPVASNPAVLAGLGVDFGKRVPSLVISAEALAGNA
tara:strand:+ start:221 stop:781 length:561 start_codon:yes stop_codon:yes gene_type:complete